VREVVGRPDDERRVGGVLLESGERLPCDLVIVATGVTPRAELAAAAGLAVNRGVLVDRRLATSHPGVYACGDAAEGYDFVHCERRVIPIWPNAYMGGRVAGFNMAGLDAVYRGTTSMNALSYFGLTIVAAGLVEPPDQPGYEVLTAGDGDRYRKVVLRDHRVVGMVFVGDIARLGIVLGLMRDGIDVGRFKEALVSERFGLVWLPEELRRERLAAAEAVPAVAARRRGPPQVAR
jgi:NAD(P)H-nitrite reductase large subunit